MNNTQEAAMRLQSKIIRDLEQKVSELKLVIGELAKQNKALEDIIADYQAQEITLKRGYTINVSIN